MRTFLWAVSGALLLPLLLLQGRRARARTPRLPEASGPSRGETGTGPVLRLTVIGESPVAGVGVATYEEAIAAQLARGLAMRLSRTVAWTALGENGADAAGVLARLVPRLEASDCALIAMGVNDTTHFTPLPRWRERMLELTAAVQRTCSGPVIVAGVPPMHRFTALPQPLRAWIGLRAAILDTELRRSVASRDGVLYLAVPALADAAHLAHDGYHPSAAGCAQWAARLADEIVGAASAATVAAKAAPTGR